MTRLIMFLATGGYSGRLPRAPGTWGTLVAFPIHYLIRLLPPGPYLLTLAGIILLAVIAAGMAEKILDHKDAGEIVIDEIAGMLVTLIGAPNRPEAWLLGFALFRFFDIVKPFPIGWVDRHLNGGTGIVMDDLIAGLFSLALLQGACRLLGW